MAGYPSPPGHLAGLLGSKTGLRIFRLSQLLSTVWDTPSFHLQLSSRLHDARLPYRLSSSLHVTGAISLLQ